MSSKPDRLYGLPHAEEVFDDIATVWENEIEPYADDHDTRAWVIEEWTVRDPIDTVTKAEWILELIAEHIGDTADITEDAYDDLERAVKHEDVVAACESMRQAIAKHIRYHMADKRVATHTLTVVDSEPLIDGKPLYRKS